MLGWVFTSMFHHDTSWPTAYTHIHNVHNDKSNTRHDYWSYTLKHLFSDIYWTLEPSLDLECSIFGPEITAKRLPLWRCLGVKDWRLSGGGARGGHRVQERIDVGRWGVGGVVSSQDPCSGDDILFKTRARLGPPLHVPLVCVCVRTHTCRAPTSITFQQHIVSRLNPFLNWSTRVLKSSS